MNADEPMHRLVWPDEPTIESLGQAVGRAAGFDVVLQPIPPEYRCAYLSGLTYATTKTAHVFYDDQLSPLLRGQTIMHEYAHLLHGDVEPDSEPLHLRSMFNDPREHRAELTGTRLWQALQRRKSTEDDELVDFILGKRG